MTKSLEELLNLPPTPNVNEAEEVPEEESTDVTISEEDRNVLAEADFVLDKIDRALPTVHDLDTTDQELDELSNLAKSTFQDLVDFGMNVEPRFTKDILGAAATLLGHAITAKSAKVDSKLKRIDLQIRKQRLDQQAKSKTETPDNTPNGDGEEKQEAYDRNTLLATVISESRKNLKDS